MMRSSKDAPNRICVRPVDSLRHPRGNALRLHRSPPFVAAPASVHDVRGPQLVADDGFVAGL